MRVQRGDPLQTYKARRRTTAGQAEAIERLLPALGVTLPFDPAAVFGRVAPLVLEIGSGMGEATAAMAAADPDRDVVAVEVHTPGVGALLRRLEAAALTNVRVAELDGRDVLDAFGTGSLDEVRVYFPDPWPKARHHKRRLVTPAFAAAVADRLRDGGRLHVATDWPDYADQVLTVLAGCGGLQVVGSERGARPVTRFEARGVAAGRPPHDLVAVRLPRLTHQGRPGSAAGEHRP